MRLLQQLQLLMTMVAVVVLDGPIVGAGRMELDGIGIVVRGYFFTILIVTIKYNLPQKYVYKVLRLLYLQFQEFNYI